MSLRKPILKVTRECPKCKGSGSKTIKSKNIPEKYFLYPPFMRKVVGEFYHFIVDCKKCKATGFVDVKKKDSKFKNYYQKTLEERVDDLTTEYRNAKAEAFDIGEELRKYCKELDKVVNK